MKNDTLSSASPAEILKRYKTAHQLAAQLLSLPDRICIISVPVFDAPGCSTAQPVTAEPMTVENMLCILIRPTSEEELNRLNLLPCPFCGELPEHRERTESAAHPGNFWPEHVQCKTCRILFRTGENGVEDAPAYWNKRAAASH